MRSSTAKRNISTLSSASSTSTSKQAKSSPPAIRSTASSISILTTTATTNVSPASKGRPIPSSCKIFSPAPPRQPPFPLAPTASPGQVPIRAPALSQSPKKLAPNKPSKISACRSKSSFNIRFNPKPSNASNASPNFFPAKKKKTSASAHSTIAPTGGPKVRLPNPLPSHRPHPHHS